MSRSNPNEQLESPCKRYFEWDGADGGFRFYDKEKKERVKVDYPFDFLVLDTLVTFKGYNEPEDKGYWSNEVKSKDISKATFTVKSKTGVECVGSYSECKQKLESKGLSYVASVYVAYKMDGELVIANLQLKGAAVGPWIEFCKHHDIYKVAVRVDSHTNEKKGRVEFVAPVFKAVTKVKPETADAATELDKKLQEYLAVYFERNNSVKEETIEESVAKANTPEPKPADKPKPAAVSDNLPPVFYSDEKQDDEPF